MRRMEGKAGLVTGAGNGIGRASALSLAADGARLAVCDIDPAAGGRVVAEIEAAGGAAFFVRCDVTSEAEVQAMVEAVVTRYGGLDFAHNNAGAGTSGQSIETMTVAQWDWTMDISLKGCWLSMKYELPAMRARGGGSIVNTASMSGVRYASASSPAYAAAKAAVIHLTRYAAHENAAHNIRVNSISPGLTLTPIIEKMFSAEQQAEIAGQGQLIARAIRPDEIAEAVLFLCSERSLMITGTNMEVCGGTH